MTDATVPRAAPQDEDEVEPCTYLVAPSDNIYSFFMFISPTESKKVGENAFSWDIVMAYLLVGLNFFMQGVLIYLIYEAVVTSNIQWQNGVVKLGGHDVGLFSEGSTSKCNDGGSLCFRDGGSYSCAPPSIQLTGRWGELDTNGDGIWTREEVEAEKEKLQCKYVVNPVEVFDVLVNMLVLRKDLIWLHPDVESGKAIHFPYFTYAMGDLIMCGYRSQDMCSNLLERGFFHEALKTGKAPRVGKTIESALDYCKKLLQPGGTCETLLPSTYTVWKISSGIECGSPGYAKFTYTNPGNGVTKSLLHVDYSVPAEYELAQQFWFKVYKSIILCLWIFLMYTEMKEMQKIIAVVIYFPDAEGFGHDAVLVEQDPADPEDVRYRIQGIESHHRTTMAILTFFRAMMTLGLAIIGTSYIVKTNGYADLLMNGVTLAFVAELAALLYALVLREEIRDQCEDIKPMHVRMMGIDWLNRRPAVADMFSVFMIFCLVYGIMEWQMQNVVLPVYGSLTCTCGQTGEACLEAQKFNHDFWNHYWGTAVPGVFGEVDKLKAATPGAAMMFARFAEAFGKPLLNETIANHDLEMHVRQLTDNHNSLASKIETLEEKFNERLGLNTQPPSKQDVAASFKTQPPAIVTLSPKRSTDVAHQAQYEGSTKKFGQSLLENRKHDVRTAL
jgi:hypothetical protein